jgi:hypothetical protein
MKSPRLFLAVLVLLLFIPAASAGEDGGANVVTFGPSGPGLVTTATFADPADVHADNSIARPDNGDAEPTVRFEANRCVLVPSSDAGDFVFSNSTMCNSFVAPDPGKPVDPTDTEATINALVQSATDRAVSLATTPRLAVSPRRVGLTGLETYLWIGNALRPVIATASVPGLTVTARATPASFRWTFGEGPGRTTKRPGRAWTKRRAGSIGHTYESHGHYRIAVEVLWEALWRVNDGPWRRLGTFSNSDERVYPVRQVASRLVRNRD